MSSKRRAVDTLRKASTRSDELLSATARLSLASAAALRQVKAITVQVLLLSSQSSFVIAAHQASKKWSDLSKEARQKQPPFLFVFKAAVQFLLQHKDVDYIFKDRLNTILGQLSDDDVLKKVKFCRISRCYDASRARLEISLSEPFAFIQDELCRILRREGAVECHGSAPRSPLERQVMDLLGRESSSPDS